MNEREQRLGTIGLRLIVMGDEFVGTVPEHQRKRCQQAGFTAIAMAKARQRARENAEYEAKVSNPVFKNIAAHVFGRQSVSQLISDS